ncbi:GbsR/MarR family transcriptional regulator [Mycobacterium sp. 852002-51057_SCH5723018]|uniref:GbsR/MarR family transcriptional regulator n=1 Tax=Mycobacterium sp. 852002-51057_SCH5723018 TaxID=1834094 RepID=UPI000801572D|nr:MarR family transcriptional regulator [Mycobacterium sp. 852002-51057_SCH5723018]OBG24215.1 MarR family transcriptional regulator [Mycobacterium sp. 852002-51057_SCH5723018]
MSPEEGEFVDRIGLFFELLGASRTMGRIYGWLLICDPPQQSLTQLAAALSVSKASISTVARQLQDGGMVERLPSPNRQHLYRVTPGGFTSVLETQLSLMRRGIEPAEFALSVLGDDRAEQRQRVEDFRDFCEFCTQAYRDQLMRMWTEYREGRKRS